MTYQSEGEYQDSMSAQGYAESEWQAHADYHNYLSGLYEKGEYYEYYLHKMADELDSKKFKDSGKTPSQYLRDLISELHKSAEENNSDEKQDLPF